MRWKESERAFTLNLYETVPLFQDSWAFGLIYGTWKPRGHSHLVGKWCIFQKVFLLCNFYFPPDSIQTLLSTQYAGATFCDWNLRMQSNSCGWIWPRLCILQYPSIQICDRERITSIFLCVSHCLVLRWWHLRKAQSVYKHPLHNCARRMCVWSFDELWSETCCSHDRQFNQHQTIQTSRVELDPFILPDVGWWFFFFLLAPESHCSHDCWVLPSRQTKWNSQALIQTGPRCMNQK